DRYSMRVARIRQVDHRKVPFCLGEMVPLGGTPPLEVAQVVVILGRGSYRDPPTWAFQRLYIAMVRLGVEAVDLPLILDQPGVLIGSLIRWNGREDRKSVV